MARAHDDEASEGPRQGEAIAHLWARAAHDLRQPVQAALLVVRMLEQELAPAEANQAAGHIAASLESLSEMLEFLVLLSRIEAGLQTVPLRPCRLADVLKVTMADMAEIAAARSVRLRFRNMQGVVRSNSRLLSLAARSLLLNAIRFGNGRGILASCRRRGNQLRLEVRFEGGSLDAAARGDAFVQLAPLRDRAVAGELGLGLFLLEHLCRRLGHSLHCAASPQGGQLLAIELPAWPEAMQQPSRSLR